MSEEEKKERAEALYSWVIAQARYSRDANPLHLWTVYRLSVKWGFPMSEMVTDYLGEVAEKLDPSSPYNNINSRSDRGISKIIMQGKRPNMKRISKHNMIIRAALAQDAGMELDERERGKIADKFEVDESTVKRCIDKWLEES